MIKIGLVYEYSKMLELGNYQYTTKPYVCEYPQVDDTQFLNFARAVRVDPTLKSEQEDYLGKATQRVKAAETFEVWVILKTFDDMNKFLKDLKSIHANGANDSTGYYVDVDFDGSAEITRERGKVLAKFIVSCLLRE